MELILVSIFVSFCALVLQVSEFVVYPQTVLLARLRADRPRTLRRRVPEPDVVCAGGF